MTCRDISPSLFSDARTLEDAYRALGVLRPSADGRGEAAPRLVFPEGYTAEELPYLSGTDHTTFNVNPLFANGGEQLNCTLRALGYNADRARQIDTESNAITSDEEYDRYMANLTPQDAMTYNIFRTLEVVDFFRTDDPRGGGLTGGNTDGNPDLITTSELDAWAWEVSRHNEDEFYQQGGDVVARMHALVGLVTLLNSPAPVTDTAGLTVISGNSADVAAPVGGWHAGDRVYLNDTLVDGNPTSGTDAFRLLATSLPVGAHTVEIRRANGSVVRTPLTVTNPPEEPGFFESYWRELVIGVGAVLGVSALVAWASRRGESRAPSRPGPSGPSGGGVRAATPVVVSSGPSAPAGGTNVQVTVNTSDTRTGDRGGTPAPTGYGDVLNALEGSGEPSGDVLAALDESAAPVAGDAFTALLTETIDPVRYEAELRAVDPALADYFLEINSSGNPVTTFNDIATRMAVLNPEALEAAQSAIRSGSFSGPRAVLELMTRGSGWSPEAGDLADHTERVTRFEAAIRETRSESRSESAAARAERERREARERDATRDVRTTR